MRGRTNILPIIGGTINEEVENYVASENIGIGKFVQTVPVADVIDYTNTFPNGGANNCVIDVLNGYVVIKGNAITYFEVDEQNNTIHEYSKTFSITSQYTYCDLIKVSNSEFYIAIFNSNNSNLYVYKVDLTFSDGVFDYTTTSLYSGQPTITGSTPYVHFLEVGSNEYLVCVEKYRSGGCYLSVFKFYLQGGVFVPDSTIFGRDINNGFYGGYVYKSENHLVWIYKNGSNVYLQVNVISLSDFSSSVSTFSTNNTTDFNCIEISTGKYLYYSASYGNYLKGCLVSVSSTGGVVFGSFDNIFTHTGMLRLPYAFKNGNNLFFVCRRESSTSDFRTVIILVKIVNDTLTVLDSFVYDPSINQSGYFYRTRNESFKYGLKGVIVFGLNNKILPLVNSGDNLSFLFTIPKVKLYETKISGVSKTGGSTGDTIQVYIPPTT